MGLEYHTTICALVLLGSALLTGPLSHPPCALALGYERVSVLLSRFLLYHVRMVPASELADVLYVFLKS